MLLNRYTGDDDIVFGATVSGRPGSLAAGDNIVGPDLRFAAYRVIEEALGNVAKHAQASHAWVAVEARLWRHEGDLVAAYGELGISNIGEAAFGNQGVHAPIGLGPDPE